MTKFVTTAAIAACLTVLAGAAQAQAPVPPVKGAYVGGSAPAERYPAQSVPSHPVPGKVTSSTTTTTVSPGLTDRTTTTTTVTPGYSGSTGMAPAAPVAGTDRVIARIDTLSGLEGRVTGEQDRMAVMQTTLLNTMSQLGFQTVRDFRRSGDAYVAEALTMDGNWRTIEIDGRAGTISYAR